MRLSICSTLNDLFEYPGWATGKGYLWTYPFLLGKKIRRWVLYTIHPFHFDVGWHYLRVWIFYFAW